MPPGRGVHHGRRRSNAGRCPCRSSATASGGNMTGRQRGDRLGRPAMPSASDEWLASVAASAAVDARAPADLLGEYLPLLAAAAINGRRPDGFELDAVRELGRRAAAQGVGARGAVDLYLSAAWRLWRQLPVVVRSSDTEKVRRAAEAVLRVLDDAIGVLVDGHQAERREMIRHEEAQRAEFVDDLLRGDADVSRLDERAEPFGVDLGKPHRVALVAALDGDGAADRAAIALERAVVERFGDREVLVATKDGRVVVIAPPNPPPPPTCSLAATSANRSGRNCVGRNSPAAGASRPGVPSPARMASPCLSE